MIYLFFYNQTLYPIVAMYYKKTYVSSAFNIPSHIKIGTKDIIILVTSFIAIFKVLLVNIKIL